MEVPSVSRGTNIEKFGDVELQSLVYEESKFPLSDFFRHLKRGDYRQAFRRLDLRYQSSNVSNKALSELIEAGFVPVYVNLRNTGAREISLNEKSFVLVRDGNRMSAFFANQLPTEFAHFDPAALAANVYNTGVVIVGFAAVMGVFVLAAMGTGADLSPLANTFSSGPNGSSSSSSSSTEVYNSLDKKTIVDPHGLLIHETTLAPGDSARGLLFFYQDKPTTETPGHLEFYPRTNP